MKKFILLTLLASGLSAHAMPGDSPQENGGQGMEVRAMKDPTQR